MAKANATASKSTSSGPPGKASTAKAPKTVRAGPSTKGGTGTGLTAEQLSELNHVYAKGEEVWALTRGLWHRAQVKDVDTATHPEDTTLTIPISRVHYPGWGARWDEWVMGDSVLADTPENEILALKQNATTNADAKAGKATKKTGKPTAKKEAAPKPAKQVTVPITKKKTEPASTSPVEKKSVEKTVKAPVGKRTVKPKVVKPKVVKPVGPASVASSEAASVGKRPARGAPPAEAAKTDEYAFESGSVSGVSTDNERNGKTIVVKGRRGGRKPAAAKAPAMELIEPTVSSFPVKLNALRGKRPVKAPQNVNAEAAESEEGTSATAEGGEEKEATANTSPSRIPTIFDPVLVGVAEKVRLACAAYLTTKFSSDDIGSMLDTVDDLTNSLSSLKQAGLNFLHTNVETIVESPQWQTFAAKRRDAALEYLEESRSGESAAKKSRTK